MILPPLSFLGQPADAPAGHRYWRIYITANSGDSTWTVLGEVEMHTSISGADVCTGGTAISGGTGADGTGNEASKAFDNNTGTLWGRNGGAGDKWVGYDFGAGNEKDIVEFTLFNGNSVNPLTRPPSAGSLQWSDDGSGWTTAISFTVPFWTINQTWTFPEPTPVAGYHRCWRVFSLANGGGASTIMDEVEFRATSGGADQTTAQSSNTGDNTGRAWSNIANSGGNDWYRAFNNVTNTSNYWSAVGVTANAGIGFIFAVPVKVEEIQLISANVNANRAPTSLQIEYSDDLVSWTSQKAHAGLSWTTNETKVLAAI